MEEDGETWVTLALSITFQRWGCVMCGALICHVSSDEEEEENTEDQDERGNLRGLIDDGDEEPEEEEEAQKSGSAAGSDSEEEVRHRRKKRSKLIRCFFKGGQPLYHVLLQVVVSLKKSQMEMLYWNSTVCVWACSHAHASHSHQLLQALNQKEKSTQKPTCDSFTLWGVCVNWPALFVVFPFTDLKFHILLLMTDFWVRSVRPVWFTDLFMLTWFANRGKAAMSHYSQWKGKWQRKHNIMAME